MTEIPFPGRRDGLQSRQHRPLQFSVLHTDKYLSKDPRAIGLTYRGRTNLALSHGSNNASRE